MAPKLYGIPASPPVRAVLLCAKALRLKLEFKLMDLLNGEHLKEEYLKLNPAGTIPTLVDDDGFVLWDSHAIITYLVSKYGKDDSLYPKDLQKRAKIDQKLHFDSSTLFARGIAISRPIFLGSKTSITEEEKENLRHAYKIVESFLENSKYVAGDQLTVADFSIATTLSTVSFFEPIEESKYPKIHDYMRRMESLPYFKEANQEGKEMFVAAMKSKLNL